MRARHPAAAILTSLAGPLVVGLLGLVVFQVRVRHDMVDFGVYRTAGLRAAQGQALYRPDDGHYQFKYLPAFAIAVAPLAYIDDESAKTFWFFGSLALLIIFVRWSVRFLPERRRRYGPLLALVVVFMAKFYLHELLLGQANLMFGVLLLAALGALDLDHHAIAGGLIAAAICVKPYGVIFAPWLLMIGGRRAMLSFAGALLMGLLLPVVRYGWSGNLHLLAGWYHTVTDSTAPNLVVSDNISFAGMWAKWIGAGRAASTLAAASIAGALVLAAWCWSRRSLIESPNYLEFAQLMLFVPLFSPQGWDYVLLLGTPAVALLIDRSPEMHPIWRWAAIGAAAVMGLSIFDVMGRALYAEFMAASIVTLCAAVLAASLAYLRARSLA